MLSAGLTTDPTQWDKFCYSPTVRWTEEGGAVQPAQITAMKQIGDMLRNKSPLLRRALAAPVIAAGGFFSPCLLYTSPRPRHS